MGDYSRGLHGRWLATSAAIVCMTVATPAMAQTRTFDIPAQDASRAIPAFAKQAGIQLLAPARIVRGKKTRAVRGSYSVEEALRLLLQDSGLELAPDNGTGIMTVRARAGKVALSADRSSASREVVIGSAASNEEGADIVVTGTNIRGVKDRFSPINRVSRDDMDRAGLNTVAEVLAKLPQNFGGGVSLNTISAGSNTGIGASGINLRGLGNEATLVLLNGRRLPQGGTEGGFVDVSTIPTSAIDRIEVASDGASAIYGSDAVAGVVNVILRHDFNGAESRINLSTITDSGDVSFSTGQTVGLSRSGYHGLITFEYASERRLGVEERDFSRFAVTPQDLLPSSRKFSIIGSGGAELGSKVSVSMDGYYNWRRTKGVSTSAFAPLIFADTFAVSQYGGVGAVDVDLGNDWTLTASGSHARNDQHGTLTESLGGTGTIADSNFKTTAFDLTVGGPLFRLTDEPVRAVAGAHRRNESQFRKLVDRDTLVGPDISLRRNVFAAFGELYAPIITGSDATAGMRRLAFNLAGRYERYSDVGSSFNYKAAVAWMPAIGFNLRGTYGTSFRAPTLQQLRGSTPTVVLGVFSDPSSPSGTSPAILVSDLRNDDLEPERATTWSLGADLNSSLLPGFELRVTYFSINYRNRITRPDIAFDENALFTNFSGSPLRNVSPAVISDFVSGATAIGGYYNFADFFPDSPFFAGLSPDDVSVVLDQRPQNAVTSKVSGFDVGTNYKIDLASDRLSIFANATIFTKFTQQFQATPNSGSILNTFGNPVRVKVRSGAVFERDRTTTGIYLNHVGSYRDDEAVGGPVGIRSWTTLDATLSVRFGATDPKLGQHGSTLTLSVINILNQSPPRIGQRTFDSPFYDSANADPFGRRVGLLFTKQW